MNYQSTSRPFISKEGTEPVRNTRIDMYGDPVEPRITNDRLMVDLGLRQPLQPVYDFKKTSEEKLALQNAKASYTKLKKNPIAFRESKEYIIKQFISKPMPNFGVFIFN